jgi:hypothetical protein
MCRFGDTLLAFGHRQQVAGATPVFRLRLRLRARARVRFANASGSVLGSGSVFFDESYSVRAPESLIRSLTVFGHFYRLGTLTGMTVMRVAPGSHAAAPIVEFDFPSTLKLCRPYGKRLKLLDIGNMRERGAPLVISKAW